jgi:hypothetical protein
MTSDAVSPNSDQPQADFSDLKALFIICRLEPTRDLTGEWQRPTNAS